MIYDLGSNYFVRAFEESDLAGPYTSWFQDQDVCKYNSHGSFQKNNNWFRSFYEGLKKEDQVVWAICHKEDGHIGNVALQNLSFINRNAAFSILLGNKKHWGKSVGLLVGQALLQHGFDKLNLNKMYCGTAATNKGMIKLANALGMSEEGRRRQHLFLEGQWVDVLEFGVLKDEFENTMNNK